MSFPSFRLLHPSDYRAMPWKNGGGTTMELIIEPEGASLDGGFLWRLSMADVGVSGPFSRFEGCDRTLLLLEGRGMELGFDQRPAVRLGGLLEPVAFSGDWRTEGTLLDGPCRDFNVITRRAGCRHRLEVLRLGTAPAAIPHAWVRFLFCVSGKARVEGSLLSSGDLLRAEGAGALEARAAGGGEAVVISVGIAPAGGAES